MYSLSDLEKFVPVPDILQRRSKLTSDANILYSWCWRFYKNLRKQGKHFYLNWYQAAIILHKSPATAKRVMKELKESGLLIHKDGEKMADGSHIYHVADWRELQNVILQSDEEYQTFLNTLDKVKHGDAERWNAYIEQHVETDDGSEVSYPHAHTQPVVDEQNCSASFENSKMISHGPKMDCDDPQKWGAQSEAPQQAVTLPSKAEQPKQEKTPQKRVEEAVQVVIEAVKPEPEKQTFTDRKELNKAVCDFYVYQPSKVALNQWKERLDKDGMITVTNFKKEIKQFILEGNEE